MLDKLKALGTILVMVLGALIAAFTRGKKQGKDEVAAEATQETLEQVDEAKQVRETNAALSDDDVVARLRKDWTRK